MSRLLLIDTNNLAMRAHFAECDPLKMIYGLARRHRPTHWVCVRDPHGPTWRHEADPAYKAQRPERAVSSTQLVDEVAPRLAEAGIPLAAADGFEGDDLIATLVARAWERGTDVLVCSRDKDLLALADRARIIWPENGGTETLMDADAVFRFLGVQPYQVPHWKALAGDKSDNIPRLGALKQTKAGPRFYGFTEARAAELLCDSGTLDDVLRLAGGWRCTEQETAWLRAGRERALLNLRLATLREDVPLALEARTTRVRQSA
jgi:DNA polymerase-1